MNALPFSDLRVVELASVLAGPSVGQFFAELGAEVIKVENPKTNGDVTRSWKGKDELTDDRSAYFCSVNWGKKSIALDISKQEDLQCLYAIVEKSDIVITSYKPGDDLKLKVDYESLKRINPLIIYGQITGYGPLSNDVGYDAVIQAEVGFMHLNGEPNSKPLKMPVALMDLLAGHQLKEALLIGYIQRLKSGAGSKYEVSLVESGLTSLANQATNFLIAKKEPQAKGSLHPNIAPYGEMFTTADEKVIVLAIGSDKQFELLLSILNLESKESYKSNSLRVANREALSIMINNAIASKESDDLLNKFAKNHIPAGIVNKVSDAINDYSEYIQLKSQSGLEGLKTFVANSLEYKNSSHILPPPHFGEHSEEIKAILTRK